MTDHEIKVTRSFFYTDDDFENICVTALEGGIGYWACLDNSGDDWKAKPKGVPTSVWFWKLLKDGKEIYFTDAEDDDVEFFIDISLLFEGIAKAIELEYWDGDMDSMDAEVADMIFQHAIFGEVVYG